MTLAQHRALHAGQAARLRRFADENAERGLDHFAALDLAEADRQQAMANAITVTMLALNASGCLSDISGRRAA